MDYQVVEHDFISRTLELLQQYDSAVAKSMPVEKRFEVTLLINCLCPFAEMILAISNSHSVLTRGLCIFEADFKN